MDKGQRAFNLPLPASILPIGLAVSLGIAAAPAIAEPLEGWKYDPSTSQLQFVINDGIQPRYFLMAQPARIVVDLPDTQIGTVPPQQTFPQGAIRQITVTQLQPQLTRIVLEMSPDAVFARGQVALQRIGDGDRSLSDRWMIQPLLAQSSSPAPVAVVPGGANLSTPTTIDPKVPRFNRSSETVNPPTLAEYPPGMATILLPETGSSQAPQIPSAAPVTPNVPSSSIAVPVPSVPRSDLPTAIVTVPGQPPSPTLASSPSLSAPRVAPANPVSKPVPSLNPASAVVNPPTPAEYPPGMEAPIAPENASDGKVPSVSPTVASISSPSIEAPNATPPSGNANTPNRSLNTGDAVKAEANVRSGDTTVKPAPETITFAPNTTQSIPIPVPPPEQAPAIGSSSPTSETVSALPPTTPPPPVTLSTPQPSLESVPPSPIAALPVQSGSSPVPSDLPAALPAASSNAPVPVSVPRVSVPPVPSLARPSGLPPSGLAFPANAQSSAKVMPRPQPAVIGRPGELPPDIPLPSKVPTAITSPVQTPMPATAAVVAETGLRTSPTAVPAGPTARSIEFGQAIPGQAAATAPASTPMTTAAAIPTSRGDLVLPSGTALSLRYTGIDRLTLKGNNQPRQEILVLQSPIRDTAGNIIAPEGSLVLGQFETTGGTSRFVAQTLSVQGRNLPIAAQSAEIGSTRRLSDQQLLQNSGLGALAGVIVGGLSGGNFIGGAAAGAAITYATTPKSTAIEPGQTLEIRLTQDLLIPTNALPNKQA